MKYSEYLTQENPVRMPNVIVDPMWYTLGHTIRLSAMPNDTITQITLKGLEQYNYVLKGKDKRVWTTDQDGNPKSRSCFSIK